MSFIAQRIGICGDLHLDDRQVGRHKNYYANCVDICEKITNVIKEKELTHLILLGDLFGNTQHIVQKQSARIHFTEYFVKWNQMLNGNVYSVIGNHDKGAYATDFELLVTTGLVKIPRELDVGAYRIHFLNYGESNRALNMAQDKENVVVAHEYFTIEGQTNYIKARGGLELSDMQNLKGVSLVVCGHIHNPSKTYLNTRIDGTPIYLYYPGCLTRPSKERDLWDVANILVMTSMVDNENPNNTEVAEEAVDVTLAAQDEVFLDTPALNAVDVDVLECTNVEVLGDILRNLQEYNLTVQGGYKEQIHRFGGMDSEATATVLKYVEQAEQYASQVQGVNPN